MAKTFAPSELIINEDGDVGVGNAWLRYHQHDLCTLDGSHGSVYAHTFDMVIGVTDAGSVDKSEGDALYVDGILDGVAGSSLNVADDGSVVVEEGVQEG